MTELIQKTDSLNDGRVKLNEAIKDADIAKVTSKGAEVTAGQAKQIAQSAEDKAESTQTQLDTVIIESGTSDAETLQARVDEEGTAHPTVKARVDEGFAKVATQLADNASDTDGIIKNNVLEAVSKSEALSRKNTFHFPSFKRSENNPLITRTFAPENPITGMFYTLQFATVLAAYKYFADPIDRIYLYASSHDSDGVWLFTAPTPEGPFTLYSPTPVVQTSTFNWATGHVSSPDVHFDDIAGKVYLYVHAPVVSDVGKQFTGLATSLDGITFEQYSTTPKIASTGHINRWNGKSVSYVRLLKEGRGYYGVYQANNSYVNDQTGLTTVSVGACYSSDGLTWVMYDEPLMVNNYLSRGGRSPTLFKWNDYFLIVYQDDESSLSGVILKDFGSSEFESVGVIFKKGAQSSYDSGNILSPSFFYDEGVLYLYYGHGGTSTGISVAKAEVNF